MLLIFTKFAQITLLFIACIMFGCSTKNPKHETDEPIIYLGSLHALQILPNTLHSKPTKEIARICASSTLFHTSKQYEILTFENLLKAAQAKTKQNVFSQVGIWQQHWNMLVWQKKCLILGE